MDPIGLRPEAHFLPVANLRSRDALAVEEGAIGAALVGHGPDAGLPLENSMLPGHGRVVHHVIDARRPPEAGAVTLDLDGGSGFVHR